MFYTKEELKLVFIPSATLEPEIEDIFPCPSKY